MLHRVRELRGDAVVAKDGEAGAVDDVVFENRRWDVRFVVVKMQGRRVLVSPAALDADTSRRAVRVSMTRDEVEHCPPRDAADPELCRASSIMGYDLETPDGAIGHVSDFLVDDQSWAIADMVVDTRSWLPGGRRVLVPPSAVEGIDDAARKVRVRLSREEVRNARAL
jgi:sporulation protein YlmC with PRC-barrel domain